MSIKQEQLDASEEVVEVAPGVLRAQLPILLPGLGHVNCYVLEDSEGATLIDPGLPDPPSHQALMSRLSSIGIPAERIHTVLVTHSHPDHFGGAGRLKVEQHCKVIAHDDFQTPFDAQPLDADLIPLETKQRGPYIDDGEDLGDLDLPELDGPVNSRLARILFGQGDLPSIQPRSTPWGEEGYRPDDGELDWMRSWDRVSKQGLLSLKPNTRVSDEEWITLGDREWQVIHTPGHTGDHLCLLDPTEGTLLSGDHVLPTITPHISGMTQSEDSLADFFAGLQRVADIPGVKTVLPAHGLPFQDLPKRTAEIIEHHHDRLEKLIGIAQDLGSAGVRAYSHELFKERSWGPMAESETYAHLEHLRIAGKITRSTGPDGKLVYSPLEP